MTPQSKPSATGEIVRYDDAVVRRFIIATLLWGAVGMLVGVIIAAQLAWWPLNAGLPWLSFGRLRPLHTNAVIFAFAGNTIFAGIYYSLQRLCKARMWSDLLTKLHFWGWQLIIVAAAITLPLGITTSKEYAELEWPLDVAIALVWVAFAANLFGTIARRRERHIYVAIWFYIATVLTVAMLHIVNSLALPVSGLKSYSVFAGVQDALVQWWYGHNAVAFFLTTPFLGLMYYFVPKAAGRPVYSYRLSVIHFWSLVFLYIWAGPHHLLNTSLPEWAQTMGVVFSVMLLAPSWGGMINGLLTLRGAWDKLRTDPILKFFVVGITFYGMSTFEGPMLSIKQVNALSHYTDWTIAHVHGGALGWNGFIAFGMIYYLIPKLWKVPVYSARLVNTHFWISTIGIVVYIVAMWTSGVTQGLMWRATTADGLLKYPDFVETVTKLIPFYWIRMFGGLLYLTGLLLMIFNLIKTIRVSRATVGSLVDSSVTVGHAAGNVTGSGTSNAAQATKPRAGWHHRLEGRAFQFSMLTLVSVLIGGMIELIPMIAVSTNVPSITTVHPYTPLEVEGRDIYIREGCVGCHSQMVRPFKDEYIRYGAPSQSGEFVYDRPFLFGSKRTGPDLARLGGKYLHFWHYRHMNDPRATSPGSIMPAYPWLLTNNLNTAQTEGKIATLQKLGANYSTEQGSAIEQLQVQASEIADELVRQGVAANSELKNKEIVALIAYLQRLGRDLKASAQ